MEEAGSMIAQAAADRMGPDGLPPDPSIAPEVARHDRSIAAVRAHLESERLEAERTLVVRRR